MQKFNSCTNPKFNPYTNEKLKELRQKRIDWEKSLSFRLREEKIKDRAEMLTRYILCVNKEGHKNYTGYFYNYDENFVTDIMDIIRERFPDSNIVIGWSLFNYSSITVSWK